MKADPHLKHLQALRAERERIEKATPGTWREIGASIPEIYGLRDCLAKMLFFADARKGRVIDGERHSSRDPNGIQFLGDFRASLAADTLPDRERVERTRRRLRHLVRDLEDELDPHTPRRRVPNPRCQKTQCSGKGKRQTFGQPRCGWCGEPFTHRTEAK